MQFDLQCHIRPIQKEHPSYQIEVFYFALYFPSNTQKAAMTHMVHQSPETEVSDTFRDRY